MTQKLGKNQAGVLEGLKQHGSYPGGWMWDTHSGTVKILETLVKRGLVETFVVPNGFRKGHTGYRITKNGREALKNA